MTFLSTAFLFALPIIAAPLLLHFFDRRRKTVIEWGAMQFLVEASTAKSSARRLKQWLLLLLRVVALAALVLALARPLMPAGYMAGDVRGETVLVIDNSMSMHRKAGEFTLMDAALAVARELIAALPRRDHVRVLTTSPYPEWLSTDEIGNDTRQPDLVSPLLDRLSATQGRSDLLGALMTAITADHDPSRSCRTVVVLTDGQAADWRLSDEPGWVRFRDAVQTTELETTVELVRIDDLHTPASNGNITIDTLSLGKSIVGVNQPVNITATLRNCGLGAVSPTQIHWLVNGDEVETVDLDTIEGEQTVDIAWQHTFEQAGTVRLTAQVDANDDLLEDNRLSTVVNVVDEIPIVVVEDSLDLAEMQQDAFFVQAALGYQSGEPLGARSSYVPTLVTSDELSRIDLAKQRVVVIPNFTVLDDETVEALEQFVAEGGGLWLGLGPRADLDAFNHRLFADASGLSPLKLTGLVDGRISDDFFADNDSLDTTSSDSTQTNTETTRIDPFRIDPFRSDHPAARQLADDSRLDLGDVIVERRFQFAEGLSEDQLSVLLRLNNGQPLAVENLYGRGRVIVQGVPLRMQWSDLARSQSFVVMVRDWVDYLAEPRATRFNLRPGETLIFPVQDESADGPASTNALLTTPGGDEIELTALTRDDRTEFRSSRTRLPGNYELELGLGETRIPFEVQRDSSESNLDALTTQDADRIAASLTVDRTAEQAAKAATPTDAIWPYLLLGLIVVITVELVLSSTLAKERFGSAGVAQFSELGDASIGDSFTTNTNLAEKTAAAMATAEGQS